MRYFAFGSNLSRRRLAARIDCRPCEGIFRLERHRLLFHKWGRDGSAKCDAFYTGRSADYVLGVLYEINPVDLAELDCIEGCGAGYERDNLPVQHSLGHAVTAVAYRATHVAPSLLPFHWYLQHVVTGAQEAGLPKEYVAALQCVEVRDDPDTARSARELAVYT